MTLQTPMTPTLVKNQLIHPDGTPRRGERVDFLVRAYTDWRGDEKGRMVGTTSTWTNSDGLWRACLLPWPAYEAAEYTVVEVREGGVTSGFIKVPETAVEQWMRALLVDPPQPSGWRPISQLGDLHDVDKASVANAPDGSVLIKRGGQWVAEVPTFGKEKLAELTDVDESVGWAKPYDDTLTYLGSARGWGVTRAKPSTITVDAWYYDPDDSSTIWVPVTDFERDKHPAIFWQDNAEDTAVPTPDEYGHTYTAGSYRPSVYYTDDPNDPGVDLGTVVIPKPAGRK